MPLLPSVCPLDCPDACGLLLDVEGNKVLSCQGDPDHPFTRGFLCGKMGRFPEHLHSPERLTRPLRRIGPKGTAAFAPISWDEAIDTIVRRFQAVIDESGAEAILPYSYAGTMGLVQRNSGHAFFHRLGASRLKRTICATTADVGWSMTLGDTMGSDIEGMVDADLILIWGMNVASTHIHLLPFLQEARKKGAQVIQVDCYKNRTSAVADRVILIPPGTDTALALGMMHVLISEDCLDHAFIAEHTAGYEALKEKVLRDYAPEQVEAMTGITASTVTELGRAYGAARAPFIRVGNGPNRQWDGAMIYRTLACLPGLVGAFAKKGGGIHASSNTGQALPTAVVTRDDLQPKPAREINMIELGRALLERRDPPIQALYVYHANPAAVAPESEKVLQGLLRPDLFTVVHEQVLTDTARYADLVLPATAAPEHADLYRSYGHFYIQRARPVAPPPGEAKSNLEVFTLLATAFGFGEAHFQKTADDLIDDLLAQPTPLLEGIDRAALAAGRAVRLNVGDNPPLRFGRFQTESGRLMFENPALAERGYPTLPEYRARVKDMTERPYPLRLLANPGHHLLNSTFGGASETERREGPQQIRIAEADAAERQIVDGATVRAFNALGEAFFQARVTADVPAGVVVVEGVRWQSRVPGGKNVNHLTAGKGTRLAGGSSFNDNYVEIALKQ
ncbi:molybdopterin-dependent oxidoreductase [Heliobacterium gestii]|uniref:Molybdopterin-dependent oxidoreductase n=1 Tax=Heliomicrobium gestii TaxID=2699 RepID=A0A845L7Z0_HELGE|nr:molybdopterin-dependent oxidoreductase [Heliomicrobium gestii]MBM7866368.1 anaerobic selenocysteine-containing dehydrogenase [Heliomicrobium gestii]MZP42847.1 molybdopterin-dependent oxidoreductase [Heliomicrobium gestii]